MSTPYVPYGSAESFGQAANRLARENINLLNQRGLVSTTNSLQDGRVVGKIPNTDIKKPDIKYVYDNGEWKRTFGGYKKIAKNKMRQKCAKSSKKCRYSHYKTTAKRSRRRTNQK